MQRENGSTVPNPDSRYREINTYGDMPIQEFPTAFAPHDEGEALPKSKGNAVKVHGSTEDGTSIDEAISRTDPRTPKDAASS